MDAKQKKYALVGGVALLVGIVWWQNRHSVSDAMYDELADIVAGLNIPGLKYGDGEYTADNGGFSYAGGGANMFMDGANITWPAMNTLMPISVGGSSYRTGDMLSVNPFNANILNVAGGGPEQCCCDDRADPVTQVSAAWIIAQTPQQQPRPYQGYHNMNPNGGNYNPRWSIGG